MQVMEAQLGKRSRISALLNGGYRWADIVDAFCKYFTCQGTLNLMVGMHMTLLHLCVLEDLLLVGQSGSPSTGIALSIQEGEGLSSTLFLFIVPSILLSFVLVYPMPSQRAPSVGSCSPGEDRHQLHTGGACRGESGEA